MPKGATITRKDNPGKVKMFAKGGKVKKADGGDVEFERTPADISSDITAPESSFKDAFRDARASGDKTFTWKGKSYTTAMASDKAKAAAKPAASKPAPSAPKTVAKPKAAPSFSDRMKKQFTTSPEERKRDADKEVAAKRRGDAIKKVASSVRLPKHDELYGEDVAKRRGDAIKKVASSVRLPKHDELYGEDVAKRRGNAVKGALGMAKGGKWIQGAIKKPGALHEQLGVPKGKKIPAKKLAAAAKAPGKLGQRARFAETLKKMRKK